MITPTKQAMKVLNKGRKGHIPTIARGLGPIDIKDITSLVPKQWLSDAVSLNGHTRT